MLEKYVFNFQRYTFELTMVFNAVISKIKHQTTNKWAIVLDRLNDVHPFLFVGIDMKIITINFIGAWQTMHVFTKP